MDSWMENNGQDAEAECAKLCAHRTGKDIAATDIDHVKMPSERMAVGI